MVWVHERTIPTERPPLVGEVIANFCGQRVPCGQRDRSLRPYSRFSRQEPLLFYQVAPQLYSRGWVNMNETFYKTYRSSSTIIPLSVDQIPFHSAKLVQIFELTSSFSPLGTSTHFHWKQEWVGKTFYWRVHNSLDCLLSSEGLQTVSYILYLNSVEVFNCYSVDMNIVQYIRQLSDAGH
jgi:hypothetical protein